MQVVVGSICRGAVLVHVFEPQRYGEIMFGNAWGGSSGRPRVAMEGSIDVLDILLTYSYSSGRYVSPTTIMFRGGSF